ncbi:MAG: SPOR domain-containing protein [Pseudomonadota bacterium]
MINAEYNEIEGADAELDLSADDSLPWLEADEEEEPSADNTQIIVLALILIGVLIAAVGTVWLFGSKVTQDGQAADGSIIAAPEGPYKERPDDPGGKEFAGTGNVAPVVGEGGAPDGVLSTDGDPSANSGSTGSTGASGNGEGSAGSTTAAAANLSSSGQGDGQAGATNSRGGVAVQLAAYSSRARAEQGWDELSARTDALSGMRYRIEEGVVDIGTVYRLQAVASDGTAADRLCAELKSDGIDCQVKR